MKVAILTTENRHNFREYHKPEPYFGTAPEALFQGFVEQPDLEVHVVSCIQRPLPAPEKLAANIWFHSLVVPKLGWLRTGYQGCIRAVRKKLREVGPDMVHAQGTERDCAMTGAFCGYPNVLTIHGNMHRIASLMKARPFDYYWLAARFERMAVKRTWGVVCNSAHTENEVKDYARRTWRVPNALRQQFFSPAASQPRGPIPILANVGTIMPLKRQLEILNLAAQLHAEGYKFSIHFVGLLDESVPYGKLFRERVTEAERQGYGRYRGTMSTQELVEFFDSASGMIHFSGEESFGLVVAEGLARNLKFFGTRVGGVIDIATQVEGAELFEDNDLAGLRTAWTTWLKQGHPQPATASQEMFRRYHPDAIARQHLAIYRELLAGKPTTL